MIAGAQNGPLWTSKAEGRGKGGFGRSKVTAGEFAILGAIRGNLRAMLPKPEKKEGNEGRRAKKKGFDRGGSP
jgi:hypothetical protein